MEDVRSGMVEMTRWLPRYRDDDAQQQLQSVRGYTLQAMRSDGCGMPVPITVFQVLIGSRNIICWAFPDVFVI